MYVSECQYILLGHLATVGTECSQNCSILLQYIGVTPHIGRGQEVVVGCSPQVGRSYFDRGRSQTKSGEMSWRATPL